MQIERLGPHQLHPATTLLAKQIPGLTRARIEHDQGDITKRCIDFLKHVEKMSGTTPSYPTHHWFGAYVDGTLAGVLHAAPKVAEAAQSAALSVTGDERGGSPWWIEKFLNTVVSVEEIAVRPEYRRQGIGTALLHELHRAVRRTASEYAASAQRDEEAFIVTYAAADAQPLFARLGYTIGAPRTPIPTAYLNGMKTLWDPTYDGPEGAYCYAALAEILAPA